MRDDTVRGLACCLLIMVCMAAGGGALFGAAGEPLTVRVGVYENEPLIFTDAKGEVRGVYADIITYIAKEEGWTLTYVHGSWTECLSRLANGSIDLLVDIAYTEERSMWYDYTNETVFVNWGEVYVEKESDIETFPDLEGKTVAVVRGDVYYEGPNGIRELVKKFDITCTFVEVTEYADALRAVENGSAHAGVVNRLFGMKFGGAYGVRRSPILFSPTDLRFALPKNATMNAYLIERIDYHMKALKEDEDSVYYRSLEKYLGGTAGRVEILPRWLTTALIVLGGVILFLILVSGVSRMQVGRKTAELKESEKRYRTLFEGAGDAIFLMDEETFIECNSKTLAIFGCERKEDIVGRRPFDFSPEHQPDGRNSEEKARELIHAAFNGEPQQFYWMHLRKDGTPFDAEVSLNPLEVGGKTYLQAIVRDITARKKAEEELMKYQHQLEEMVREKSRELAESEERYRRIVESPLIAFWEVDASGVFTFVNKRLVEMAGYESEDEIVGKLTMLQCIVPEKREWLAERMQRHRNGKLEADIVETELLKKDGSRFPVIVSTAPVFNEEGELVKIVGGMIDITRRKEMEERLRTLVRQLRHVNEDLEAFASSVSHDLRAPLRALQGFGNALLEDYARALDETGREYLTRIVNAAASMDRIIQDLLAYSRLSMRDIPLTPVDMNTVVEEALELLDDDIREREAEVMVSSLPRVKGHHSTLVQVMSNLLSNAIKFVEEGKKPGVKVWAEEGNGFVRIYVRDNGIGIEREYHEKIFKPFERLHGRERYPGTGIGLAIVKKGVEKMGGSVGVESEPGKGSTFWISLEAYHEE